MSAKIIKKRKPNRSIAGDIAVYFFLLLVAFVMAFPIIYAVSSALKPLDELFKFPPKIFAQHPTLDNFSDLFVTMGKSWVTFTRYLFNTVFIPFVGTVDHIIDGSLPYELPIYKHILGKYFPDFVKDYKDNPKRQDAYIRAKRIQDLFDSIEEWSDTSYDIIPNNVLLREYIGGSIYKY